MTNIQLEEFFKVAFAFLNIQMPNKIDVKFEPMSIGKEAYFRHINANWYYFRVNDKWNKNTYKIDDISEMLSFIVHEVRHYWQFCLTNNPKFMYEFLNRGSSSLHISNWISYECEMDAEAMRFIFMSEVIGTKVNVYKLVSYFGYPKNANRKIRKLIHEERKNQKYSVQNSITQLQCLFKFLKSNSIVVTK